MAKKIRYLIVLGIMLALCGVTEAAPPLPLHNIEGNSDVFLTSTAYLANPPEEGKALGLPSFSVSSALIGEKDFVDFQYFFPSDEPAAFFIQPAYRGKDLMGWFVPQWAVNKINSLFTGCEQLGTTGETFLVNKEQYLLTESSFVSDSTILKMHLDSHNIESKFREKSGHKIITDYRGFRALTSFEVFPFLGAKWLIVAKIDEAEIITEHFQQHPKYYFEKIENFLSKSSANNNGTFPKHHEKVIMVDMDEFVKADHGELLQTVGVSTCTALIATYPGKFGYMAHISPYDKVYGRGFSNLVGHIIKKIKTYDIYKYERRYVHFIIVARHLDSFKSIIDKLIGEGFLLSQINVLHHPKARCANVIFDYSKNLACAEWLMHETSSVKVVQNPGDENNLGAITKQLLNDPLGKKQITSLRKKLEKCAKAKSS